MSANRGKYVYKLTSVKAAVHANSIFGSGDWRDEFTFDLTLSFDYVDDYIDDFLELAEIVYQDRDSGVFYRLGIADKLYNSDKQSVYLLVYPIEQTKLRFAGLCRDRRDFYFILFDCWTAFYRDENGDPAGRLRGKIIVNDLMQLVERNGAPPIYLLEEAAEAGKQPGEENDFKRLRAFLAYIRYKGRYQRYFSRGIEGIVSALRIPLLITKFLLSYISPRFRRVAYLRLRKALQPAAAVVEANTEGYWLYTTPVFLQGGFARDKDNGLLGLIFGTSMGDVFVDDGIFRYAAAGPPQISPRGAYLGRFPVKVALRLIGPSTVNPEPGDIAIGLGDYLNLYWWDFGLLRPVTPENIEQLIERNKERRRMSKYGKKYPHIDRGRKFQKEDNE